MNFEDFVASKYVIKCNNGGSIICYAGTHLANDPSQQVCILRTPGNSYVLEIENHHYRDDLESLEEILWKWYID